MRQGSFGAVYHNDVWCMSGFFTKGARSKPRCNVPQRAAHTHPCCRQSRAPTDGDYVVGGWGAGRRPSGSRRCRDGCHLGILRLLLEAGGDAGRALQVACRAGRVEIVRRWSERPAAFYISTDVYRETLIEVSEAAVSTDNDFDILFFLLQGEVLCFLDPGWLVAVVAAVVKGGAFLVLFSAIRARSRSLL